MPTTADIYDSLLQRGQSALSLPIQVRVPNVHPMTRRHTVLPPTGKALILLPSELQYLPLYILINRMYEWKLRGKAIRNYRLTERQRAGQALLIA